MKASAALAQLWQLARLPEDALGWCELTGTPPVFPSSFAVDVAAQSTIAAAALGACEFGHLRGTPRQRVGVDLTHAAIECLGWFAIDGRVPTLWDPFSGLYRCEDGWVRIHANFAHHRELALRLLGLDPATASRADAERAAMRWSATAFEQALTVRGGVATALRTFDQWDRSLQARAIASQPLLTITRVGDAPALALPPLDLDERPLSGVRVLELTRILAGPVGGRTLAAYGADVMLANSPHLPNIEAIADTSRGKRSAHVDLQTDHGREVMERLLQDAHVFLQGYRPGAMKRLGWGWQEVVARRPGIVYVSLSAYGPLGPWAERRGFDSLVQTAMGFNHAEGEALTPGTPKTLPMQILDEASGYLIAFATAAALCRQQTEGGSWHVQVSLAQTGHWLRSLGRVEGAASIQPAAVEAFTEVSSSGFGELTAIRHSAILSRTPAQWTRPSVSPGYSAPHW